MPRARTYDIAITFFVTTIVGVTFWYGQHLNGKADHDQQQSIEELKAFLVGELEKRDRVNALNKSEE